MFDNVVVVYKYIGDLMFYVTGSQDENELVLYTVLQAFYESVTILLRCVVVWPLCRAFPSDTPPPTASPSQTTSGKEDCP